jgi:signal transduction histidine kinase
MSEAVHSDDMPRVLASLAEAQNETEKTWRNVRYREARKDASWADIESTYTMRGSLYFGVTRDATGVQAAQRALKDVLLSTSFDLRCAATSVVGASSLLRSRPAVMEDAEAAFLSDAVRVSCNMLNGLASNVLELRRLERGELKVTHAPFNLRETIGSVVSVPVMDIASLLCVLTQARFPFCLRSCRCAAWPRAPALS